MILRDGAHLSRSKADCSRMEPSVVCGPRSKSAQEHMYSGFECVLEHWAHFHMKAGKCFSAPCCSPTKIEDLPKTCHNRMFPSVTDAVHHMMHEHGPEVEAYQKKRQDDDMLPDPHSIGSVAQQMVVDFMGVYASKVSIARVVGKRKWFPDTVLGRVVVGHFLREVDETQQGWDKDHITRLHTCRQEYAKWIAPASASVPPSKAATAKGHRNAATSRPAPRSATQQLTHKQETTIANAISSNIAPIVKRLPPPTGIMTALFKSVGVKGSAAVSMLSSGTPSVRPIGPVTTATSSSEYSSHSGVPTSTPLHPAQAVGGRDREDSPSVSCKRTRSDSGNSAQSRGPVSKKPHTLVNHLKTTSRNWRESCAERDAQCVEREAKCKAMEKELREIHAKHDNVTVQLDLQLKTQTARGDRYKADSDRYRKERDDARSAHDTLAKQVATLTEERDTMAANLCDVRSELTQLQDDTRADQEELREFRRTGTYVVPSGGRLHLEHHASRSEVLWSSDGSLDNCRPLSKTHMRASWESLCDLMNSQRNAVAEARKFLNNHLASHKDVDPYPGVYSCVRQMNRELEDFVQQWLAPKLPTPGDPTTILTEQLPRQPVQSSGRLMVDVLDVQEAPDSAALGLARREAEMYKDLAEQRTSDMDKLFAHNEQNVSHTSTIASALCVLVDRFRDLNLERGEGSSNPQVHREQEALEHEAEELYDILHGIVETSQPPQM